MSDNGFCRLEKAYPHMIKRDKPIEKNVKPSPSEYISTAQPSYSDMALQNLLYKTDKQEYDTKVKLGQVEKEMIQIKQILGNLEKTTSRTDNISANMNGTVNGKEREKEREQVNVLKQSSENSYDFWSNPTNVMLIQILIISGIILLLFIAFAAICAVSIGFAKLKYNK